MSHTQETTETTQGVESVFNKIRMEVIQSYPSVYSKDDVILLIDRIQREIPETTEFGMDSIDLLEKINGRVKSVVLQHDFDDDINIEIGYDRRVEVEIDSKSLLDELHENIEEVFQIEFKEN